jgi:hypothetical protein
MSEERSTGQRQQAAGADAKQSRKRLMTGVILALFAALALVFITVSGDLARGGLHPCDRLDQRLCADLGPAGCDIWKRHLSRTGAASSEPHHWRRNRAFALDLALHKLLRWDAAHADNPLCYDELEDTLYPTILAAVRASVAGKARALEAGAVH